MGFRIVLTCGQDFVREHALDAAFAIVGRDPECDVVIDDAGVSKLHMRLEMCEGGLLAEDMDSLNGIRVNGVPTRQQRLQHLDVVEIGRHKMYIFDAALLPKGGLDPECTVQGAAPAGLAYTDSASPLADTQPGTTLIPSGPVYGIKRLDGGVFHKAAPLLDARTLVGEPGKAALLVKRREKLLLTRLCQARLNLNGQEVDGTSAEVVVGDVIEVGDARYAVMRLN